MKGTQTGSGPCKRSVPALELESLRRTDAARADHDVYAQAAIVVDELIDRIRRRYGGP